MGLFVGYLIIVHFLAFLEPPIPQYHCCIKFLRLWNFFWLFLVSQCHSGGRRSKNSHQRGRQVISVSAWQWQHFISRAAQGQPFPGQLCKRQSRHSPTRPSGTTPSPSSFPAGTPRTHGPFWHPGHRRLLPQRQELSGYAGKRAVPEQKREPVWRGWSPASPSHWPIAGPEDWALRGADNKEYAHLHCCAELHAHHIC